MSVVRIIKKIGSIVIDAFTAEEYNMKANVTKYAIEDGSIISDHIQNDPIRFSVQGIISPVENQDNVQDSFFEFELLWNNKDVITIIAGLKVYENMVMTDFSSPRNKENGGSLSFSAEFEQIKKVKSQVVEIPVSILNDADINTKQQAQEDQNIGKVNQPIDYMTRISNNVDAGKFEWVAGVEF